MHVYKIAIDGPAASGKSSTASLVAEKLGFTHLISGNLYRAITYAVLQKFSKINLQDEEQKAFVKQIKLTSSGKKVFLAGKDITDLLRGELIDNNVVPVAKELWVRKKTNEVQREIIDAEKIGIVVDGRDICGAGS